MSKAPTLNDVCVFIVDCLHATAPTQDDGFPLIRTPNIGRGRLVLETAYRVSQETYDEWTRRATPEPGDLILAREATAGNVATVQPGQLVCLGQRTVHLRPNPELVDSTFLCYFLLTPQQQGLLLAGETGATSKHVNMKDIRRLPLRSLPTLPQQRQIAGIISAYDDLIENNRRRIQLLEQAARLLYKEWFVHLRFPGHEHVRITNGVPEGWERRGFPKVVDFKEGPGLRNYQYRETGIPFLNIRTFADDEIDLSKTKCLDEQEVHTKYQHFLLAEDDHVVSSSGTLGRVVTIRRCHLPLMLNTSLIRMRPIDNNQKWFLKAYLKYGDFLDQAESMAVGAAQLNFGPSHLKMMRIMMPPSTMISAFESHVAPLYTQIKCLLDGNQRLIKARDLLLPRLMNGEIPV